MQVHAIGLSSFAETKIAWFPQLTSCEPKRPTLSAFQVDTRKIIYFRPPERTSDGRLRGSVELRNSSRDRGHPPIDTFRPPQAAGDDAGLPVLVLSVLAASVFAAITTEVLPVGLLPIIAADLGASESRVGLLISAYAVVVAIGSIPLTALVARWPRRRVLCWLLTVYALSNGLFASTDNYWVALGSRLLGGLAHAGFFSVVIGAAVSIVPVRRAGRAVAFVSGGNALALALGVPLGTAVGTAIGWRWAFAGSAIVMLLLAILAAIVMPVELAPSESSSHVSVVTAVRGRSLQVVAALVVVLTLGHYTLYTYVSPLLLHDGVRQNAVSLVLLGYGIGGVLGLAITGAVIDRHPRRALEIAIPLTAACLLALGVVHSTAVVIAVVILWGVAFGTLPTLLQTAALRAVPDAPDAAPAVVNAAFNVGIAGGGVIGGRILLAAAPPAIALTAGCIAAASLVLLTGKRTP
jgi:MFS transporter, DHA1 family, inner membrane transport protein